jgi:hypothetical protein
MFRELVIILGFWTAMSFAIAYNLGFHFDSKEKQERDKHVDDD